MSIWGTNLIEGSNMVQPNIYYIYTVYLHGSGFIHPFSQQRHAFSPPYVVQVRCETPRSIRFGLQGRSQNSSSFISKTCLCGICVNQAQS